ncbi:MAG TPA: LLM class flavin-dependent oxidoreductase [Pseudomonadales bacterium]
MDIGLCLPYMKPGLNRQTVLDWCRMIDQGPFASLSCGERITGPTLEMRQVLATAAAVTERVRIVPSLYVLPMHSAVWAAKEIATLDVLSGGRVEVTVGVGGRENDYRAVGASFAKRHQRMDEQVAQMRRIWAGEPPFEGADPVGPMPLQAGGPRLLAGVMGPKSMARVAHWADGIYAFSMNGNRAEIDTLFRMADAAWEQAGRTTPPRKVGGFWYSLAPDGKARLQDYVFNYLKVLDAGFARNMADSMTRYTPEAVADALADLQRAGCDEVFLVPATDHHDEVSESARLVQSG